MHLGVNKDLLGIRDLSGEEITHLLNRSNYYFPEILSTNGLEKRDLLLGRTIANLFFENSTRTRASFELAEKRLGADVVSLSMQTSSLTKGESLLDTIKVITAMKIDGIVVRHQSAGVPKFLRKHLPENIRIINAGDGAHEHPTQALLDAASLTEAIGDLEGKRIAIVGDVLHSRVARSNILLLQKLGAIVTIAAPQTLLPKYVEEVFGVKSATTIDEVIADCDAVIMLRIQLERMTRGFLPSLSEFRFRYGLTPKRITGASPGFILHPGPVNRGVELDDEAADSNRSLIFRQVSRGVAVRMAVLEWLFT